FLGLPYDIAMYGLLLELLAKGHGYKPGKLIGQLGDCHIYKNHIDQATTIMYRTTDMYHCPVLQLDTIGVCINSQNQINIPSLDSMILHGYEHMGEIPAPLNVGK
ncbi:MAG: thymidylate synthase, partial [Candidatus Marinimicrobia bacterium]|nr:thymidylate synthase [Candidatus Neomarinimicrobiota bacterium]